MPDDAILARDELYERGCLVHRGDGVEAAPAVVIGVGAAGP
jgi:hypothetical protein